MNETPNKAAPVVIDSNKQLSVDVKAGQFWSKCTLLPPAFRDNPANCTVAVQVARNTGMEVMTVCQHLHEVKGKWIFSGQFYAALVNKSPLFSRLRYRFEGELDKGTRSCTAYATLLETGEELSATLTQKEVKASGWSEKDGNFWKKIPDQMFAYRTAAFFVKQHCPELTMGITDAAELSDVIEPQTVDISLVKEEETAQETGGKNEQD